MERFALTFSIITTRTTLYIYIYIYTAAFITDASFVSRFHLREYSASQSNSIELEDG